MTGLPDRQLFATPFAGGSSASIAPITDAGADFCFEKGFDSAFSAPHSNGGKYVTRAQMNRIGNLATKNDFYSMCGGINTFDPVFAQKIGGYPKGAVLDYFNGVNFLKVLSLVDNNTTDFRRGEFGSDWQVLNQGDQEIASIKVFETTELIVNPSSSSVTPICVFRLPKSGIVTVKLSSASYEDATVDAGNAYGMGFLGKIINDNSLSLPTFSSVTTTNTSDYKGYNLIPGLSSAYTVCSDTLSSYTSSPKYPDENIIYGNYGDICSIVIQNGQLDKSNSSPHSASKLTLSFEVYVS